MTSITQPLSGTWLRPIPINPATIPHLTRALLLFLRLQKNIRFTTDLTNLGALKNEETKPTFQPLDCLQHKTPQPLPSTPISSATKPIFTIFQARKFCRTGCLRRMARPQSGKKSFRSVLGQTGRLPPTEQVLWAADLLERRVSTASSGRCLGSRGARWSRR